MEHLNKKITAAHSPRFRRVLAPIHSEEEDGQFPPQVFSFWTLGTLASKYLEQFIFYHVAIAPLIWKIRSGHMTE